MAAEDQQQFQKMMKEFEDIMAVSFMDIKTTTPKFYHHVDTGDAKPIYQRPRRIPPAHQEYIRKEVQQLLEAGVIKEAVGE